MELACFDNCALLIMGFLEHLFSCCVTQGVVGIAIAIVSVVVILRQRSKNRLAALRELWNSRDRDVVTLHMFDRACTAPNPSPFPIKLETYLRMAGIK